MFSDWLLFWRPPCRFQRVVLNLTHDPNEAIQGVHWSTRGGWITLRDAYGLRAGKPPLRIDGDVVIHQRNVAYIQVLATVTEIDLRVAA